MESKIERNLAMLMDFYELTMANGYFKKGLKDKVVVFDMFYRKVPENGGFVIAAGLEQFIDYVLKIKFEENDIAYLKSKNLFEEEFLNYLKTFKFSGNIKAVPEGTIVYPNTPLVTIEAPLIEAQLIETMLLLTINHQSLIATKANRIVRAAKGKKVMEFGARRAHGYDAAIYGTRAAAVGGVQSTATTIADELFGIPAIGTMAHSWIQFFDTEYEAFKVYAETYPDACTLLVDTYNVLESGIPNAIRVAKEVLEPLGKKLKGIRLDSGDLAYLSKKCREMLDAHGCTTTKIVVSNSIDEYLITSLFDQGAKIDSFGVGERLITSKAEPILGGVYKLVAVVKDGKYEPRIKISENIEKVTNPCYKKLYRAYNNEGIGMFDILALEDEVPTISNLELVEQEKPWKVIHTSGIVAIKELQKTYIENGELIETMPSLLEIQEYAKRMLETVWEEEKRFINPHKHYVDLTKALYDKKIALLSNKH